MWWILVVAVWTLLAFLSASDTALALAYRGEPVRFAPLITGRLVDWYTCLIFIPGFVWLARRYPLESQRWSRHLPIHLAASLIAVALKYAIYLPILEVIFPRPNRTYSSLLICNAFTELMIFWATIAVIHAVEFYRRDRDREALALQLTGRLTRAQLDALRAQLHPHFLFNTLNAIATLIHKDPNAADAMIGRLATLLRASLQHEATHEVPLDVELALARDYVAIMEARFGARLEVTWDVHDSLHDALVPAFVLQPLIENAFEHGVTRATGPARVGIAARSDNGTLALTVADSGPGLGHAEHERIGLGNTRQRLEQLYGLSQSLTVTSEPGSGTRALVTLPLHRMPSA
jgi:signal transduction histidine kinase